MNACAVSTSENIGWSNWIAFWAGLHLTVMPGYAALVESVARAQAEVTGGEQAGAEVKRAVVV